MMGSYVEQAVVSVSPWETLGAHSHVVVWNVFGAMASVLLMFQIGIQHTHHNSGNSNEE